MSRSASRVTSRRIRATASVCCRARRERHGTEDNAAHRTRRTAGAAARTGLFLGLAFEETYKRDVPTIPGGIRTFPLVGLAGAMLYLVEPHWVLAFGVGLLAMGAWLYAFLRHEQSLEMGSARTLVVPVSNLLSRRSRNQIG